MKKILLGLLILPCFIAATTLHTNQVSSNGNTDRTTFKIMEVAYLWNLLKQDYEPNRDTDGTWLDVGLRSKYAMAKNYASLEILETTFGMPVFLRGPHGEQMDFNSNTSFGYYNPAFIQALQTSLTSALENPMFRKVLKQVYGQHLKSMALTYQDAYRYLNEDAAQLEALQMKYLWMLGQPEGTTAGSFQEEFRDYATNGYFADKVAATAYKKKNPNEDWYEKVTAPGFWLRRSIDGTDKQFYELLNRLISEMEQ